MKCCPQPAGPSHLAERSNRTATLAYMNPTKAGETLNESENQFAVERLVFCMGIGRGYCQGIVQLVCGKARGGYLFMRFFKRC